MLQGMTRPKHLHLSVTKRFSPRRRLG